MTRQHEPLFERAEQDKREEASEGLPTRGALWDSFIDGTLTLDQWAETMNALYPLDGAETNDIEGEGTV